VVLEKVMSDESVEPGERVLTSGGDQIFPKGLPVGTVTKVSPGSELFLNIRVRPAADLSRLEEVLVVTQQEEREPSVAQSTPRERAADILAQRLPSIPDKPTIENPFAPPPPTNALKIAPAAGTSQGVPGTKPATSSATQNPSPAAKPGTNGTAAQIPLVGKNNKPAAAGPTTPSQPAITNPAPRPESGGTRVKTIDDLPAKPVASSGASKTSVGQKLDKTGGQAAPSPVNANAVGSNAVTTNPTSRPSRPTSNPSQEPPVPQDQPQ
jgi:rod shape-determining protein MreC